jgi:tetratricopeptide repeat protein 30
MQQIQTAGPRTAMAPVVAAPVSLLQIPEGRYTENIYNYIKNRKFNEVIKILSNELQSFPRSRAALSLMAFCYYHLQDWNNAANWYK